MSWGDYCKFVDDNYLGKIVVPDEMIKLGDRVPYIMFYADIPEYLKWMTDNRNTNDCCIKKIWEERGGNEFISYLERVKSELDGKYNAANSLIDESNSGCIPTISVSISLTQNSADEGAFVASTFEVSGDAEYDGSIYEEAGSANTGTLNGNGISGLGNSNTDYAITDSGRTILGYPYDVPGGAYTYDENNILEVPSYLPNLMHTPFFYDDNRKIINGTLQKYGEGKGFFKVTYTEWIESGKTLYRWDWSEDVLDNNYVVGDGIGTKGCVFSGGSGEKKYRILTLRETFESLVPSDYNIDGVNIGDMHLSNDDCFFFLVLYKNENSEELAATIPFDIGTPLNLVSMVNESGKTTGYTGDIVISSSVTDGNITIEYVIGGSFDLNKNYQPNTGILLEETHPYYPAKEFLHTIDGVSAVSVYCNYIDFEADAKVGVSSYNGLSGMFTTSIIKEMPTGEVWTSPSGSIRSVIYKEDYLLGVSYEPNTDIDISYDNGSMTAWEKHFKLGECNTFQDLLDYGNHYFNL